MKKLQLSNWRLPVSLFCVGLLTACGGSGGSSPSETILENIESANSSPQTTPVDSQSNIFIPATGGVPVTGAATGTESESVNSNESGFGNTDLASILASIPIIEPNGSSPGPTLQELASGQVNGSGDTVITGIQTSRSFQVFLGSDYSPEVAPALPVAPTEPPEIDMYTLITGSSTLLNDLVPDGSIVATVRDTELEAVLGLAGDFEIALPMSDEESEIVLDITGPTVVRQSIEVLVPANADQVLVNPTLIAKEEPLTLSLDVATEVGNVDSMNRMSVSVPAQAFEFADGTIASGNAEVTITEVDITDLGEQGLWAPRMLGAPAEGEDDPIPLVSYGMADIEFTQNGELLQLREGFTATMKVDLLEPFVLDDLGQAMRAPILGETIPLWHFDYELRMWVNEGEFVTVVANADSPSGFSLVGEVAHFSPQNIDDVSSWGNVTANLTFYDPTTDDALNFTASSYKVSGTTKPTDTSLSGSGSLNKTISGNSGTVSTWVGDVKYDATASQIVVGAFPGYNFGTDRVTTESTTLNFRVPVPVESATAKVNVIFYDPVSGQDLDLKPDSFTTKTPTVTRSMTPVNNSMDVVANKTASTNITTSVTVNNIKWSEAPNHNFGTHTKDVAFNTYNNLLSVDFRVPVPLEAVLANVNIIFYNPLTNVNYDFKADSYRTRAAALTRTLTPTNNTITVPANTTSATNVATPITVSNIVSSHFPNYNFGTHSRNVVFKTYSGSLTVDFRIPVPLADTLADVNVIFFDPLSGNDLNLTPTSYRVVAADESATLSPAANSIPVYANISPITAHPTDITVSNITSSDFPGYDFGVHSRTLFFDTTDQSLTVNFRVPVPPALKAIIKVAYYFPDTDVDYPEFPDNSYLVRVGTSPQPINEDTLGPDNRTIDVLTNHTALNPLSGPFDAEVFLSELVIAGELADDVEDLDTSANITFDRWDQTIEVNFRFPVTLR